MEKYETDDLLDQLANLKQKIKDLIYEHNNVAEQLKMELMEDPYSSIPWFHSNCEQPYFEKNDGFYWPKVWRPDDE